MKKTSALAVLGLALAAPMAAVAQDAGWYLGGGIGSTKAHDFCSSARGVAGVTVTSCDERDTAFRLYGGYQINRNFGLELAYARLNAFGVGLAVGAATGNVNVDGHAIGLSVIGTLPINNTVGIYGKLGVAHVNADGRANVGAATVNVGDSGGDVTLGAGLSFNLNRNWAIRGEWERLTDNKIDVFSVNLQYKF